MIPAKRYDAIDPKTRVVLRAATAEEAAAYEAQPGHPSCPPGCRSFFKPVLVGEVLVDEDTGPGIWFGGAGF